MKIIKAGDRRYIKPWIGKKVVCRDCGCAFVLESDDDVVACGTDLDPVYTLECPACHNENILKYYGNKWILCSGSKIVDGKKVRCEASFGVDSSYDRKPNGDTVEIYCPYCKKKYIVKAFSD